MNKILDLFLQLKAIFNIITVISLIPIIFSMILLAGSDLIRLGLFRIFYSFTWFQVVIKGMYRLNILFFPLSGINLMGLLWEGLEGPPWAF